MQLAEFPKVLWSRLYCQEITGYSIISLCSTQGGCGRLHLKMCVRRTVQGLVKHQARTSSGLEAASPFVSFIHQEFTVPQFKDLSQVENLHIHRWK